MKLSHKSIRLFAILVGAAFVLYIVFDVVRSITTSSDIIKTRKAILTSVPSEYLSLFRDTDFANKFTELSTVRFPVSYFDYDHNKYCIIVTKINTIKNVSLNNLIKETYNGEEIEVEGEHLLVSNLKSDFEYSPNLPKPSNIFLRLNGDSIRVITKNDTVRTYYLNMRGFSVKYNKDSQDDLRGVAKSDYTPPTLLTFMIHNKSLYFIFISDNYDDILPTDLLNRLVLGN